MHLLSAFIVMVGMSGGYEPHQTKENPVPVSESVPEPKRTKYVRPDYPEEAAKEGLKGLVILKITISDLGKVGDVSVMRPVARLTEAAVAAVKQWEYAVTTIEGKAVWVTMTVTVMFPPADKDQ